MREKNTLIICGIICFTLIIFGILFWPTLYRYEKTTDQKLVRISRITRYTEILYPSGWRHSLTEKEFTAIPHHELISIIITGDFDGKGHYIFLIYNGTKWTIKKLRLSIGAMDSQGKPYWQRIYETYVAIYPFSKGSSSIALMDYAPQSFPKDESRQPGAYLGPLDYIPEVKIEEVIGYKGE